MKVIGLSILFTGGLATLELLKHIVGYEPHPANYPWWFAYGVCATLVLTTIAGWELANWMHRAIEKGVK